MRRSVKQALDFWLEEGLVTPEQAAALGTSLEAREREHDSGRTVAIFGAIGAVLTGLGVILFVASNWAGMGPTARLAVLLSCYGVVVAGAVLAGQRGLEKVAESLWLLATLVLGANIFLLAQTYNLTLTLWQGTFAWMLGALALGYARRSPAQAAVAVPLGILTLGWYGGGSMWFFDDQFEFLFADGGLRPVLAIVGLGLVALSTLLARREDLSFARQACFRWGLFLVAAILVISTAHVELAVALYTADFTGKQIAVIVAGAALVAAAVLAGELDTRWSKPALIATLAMLLAMLIPVGGESWIGVETGGFHLPVTLYHALRFTLYVLGVFTLALATIWLGLQARNRRLVNVGMTGTAWLIVIQYFSWSFALLDRSLAFIVGGIVLIAVAVGVEKKRRQIVAQIAE
jgi:uncharacterized membrane protein